MGARSINVPWDDPRRKHLRVTCEARERLLVVFDPAIFHDGWSGTVEVRLATAYAQQLHARLSGMRGCATLSGRDRNRETDCSCLHLCFAAGRLPADHGTGRGDGL
jgi:hypothetical protein